MYSSISYKILSNVCDCFFPHRIKVIWMEITRKCVCIIKNINIEPLEKNILLDGLYRQYHCGNLQDLIHYVDERRHGLHKRWCINGQLSTKRNFKDGKLHGLSEHWYDNGQLQTKKSYVNGKIHGVSKHWCSDGRVYFFQI